jgi:hypothetical protein
MKTISYTTGLVSPEEGWAVAILCYYRKFNAVIERDADPLPRIVNALARLNGSAVFSSIDLQSGYW